MNNFFKFTVITVLIIIVIVVMWLIGKGCQQADKQIDNAIMNYEQFQEIYNSCENINTQICQIKDISEIDKMFEQITKNQRLTSLRHRLSSLCEDYNAKSKMFNREIWKSPKLPYQLNVNQFNCY